MITKENEFISLTDGLLFKEAFGSLENRKFLEDLLESYYGFSPGYLKGKLEVEYEKLLPKSSYREKGMRGDLIVKFDDTILNIEMYKIFNRESFYKSRSYVMRIYSSELKRGKKYYEVNKVTQIKFVDEVNIEISNDIKSTIYFGPEELSRDISMDIVRLDKAREIVYNDNDKFIKYLKFIGAKTKNERASIAKGDEILMEMDNWLDFYTNDKETDEFFRTYNTEYWNKRIYNEYGRHNRNLEIAKKMLQKGEDISYISEITELSCEEVLKLKEEVNE